MTLEDTTDAMFAKSKANYILCSTPEEAFDMLASVITEAALDFETTSLHPSEGRVRLTSVCNDDVHFVIDHDFLGPFSDYAPMMMGKKWFVYNAKFETTWCDSATAPEEMEILDVDFMAKAVIGGFASSLSFLAKKTLGISLSKDEQNSDWAKPSLSQTQLDYSAFDSYVTWEIKKTWAAKMNDGHWNGFHVFNDAVRATVEAERTGLILDASYHQNLVTLWERKRTTFYRYMRRFTPNTVIANLNSDAQVAYFLAQELHPDLLAVWPRTDKTKKMQMEGAFLKTVGKKLPYPFNRWMAALVGYKYYGKYLSTYGDTLITKQNLAGKVTTRFNIGQAATGRYSSSNSNLQNIPRKVVVRRSFYSPAQGNDLMCLADYSGIEVRVLAEVSNDLQLINDAIYSDVHATALAAIHRCSVDTILAILGNKSDKRYWEMKYDRTKRGKVFTFRLTYGAGLTTLADSLRMDTEEALGVVNKWAERYPNAYAYRDKMYDIMQHTGKLPVCDGRTIEVWKADRTMPVAANYPIQAAAASVMYRAMYRVRNNFISHDLDAVIAATVHDELLSYANKRCVEASMSQQLQGMVQGWLDIFPNTNTDNLLDHAIGDSWACKP